jgi:hypothetical protein
VRRSVPICAVAVLWFYSYVAAVRVLRCACCCRNDHSVRLCRSGVAVLSCLSWRCCGWRLCRGVVVGLLFCCSGVAVLLLCRRHSGVTVWLVRLQSAVAVVAAALQFALESRRCCDLFSQSQDRGFSSSLVLRSTCMAGELWRLCILIVGCMFSCCGGHG